MRTLIFIPLMILVLGCVQPVLWAQTLSPADVPRITIEQLRSQLDNPDFVIIDVRSTKDWGGSSVQIKGAIRGDSNKLDSWINNHPKDKTIVLY